MTFTCSFNSLRSTVNSSDTHKQLVREYADLPQQALCTCHPWRSVDQQENASGNGKALGENVQAATAGISALRESLWMQGRQQSGRQEKLLGLRSRRNEREINNILFLFRSYINLQY